MLTRSSVGSENCAVPALQKKEHMMNMQTVQIEVPQVLLQRAQVTAGEELRELVTFLLERYVQELERARRDQAYEAYYQQRGTAEVIEEAEFLADFAFADIQLAAEANE